MKKILAVTGPAVRNEPKSKSLWKALLVTAGVSIGTAGILLIQHYLSESADATPAILEPQLDPSTDSNLVTTTASTVLTTLASGLAVSMESIASVAVSPIMFPVAQAGSVPEPVLEETTVDELCLIPEPIDLSHEFKSILANRGVTEKQFRDLFMGETLQDIFQKILDLMTDFANIGVVDLPYDTIAMILEVKPASLLGSPLPKIYEETIKQYSGKSIGMYRVNSIEGELYLVGYKATLARELKCNKKSIQKTLDKLDDNPQKRTRLLGRLTGITGLNNRLYSATRTSSTYASYARDFVRITDKHTNKKVLDRHLRHIAGVVSKKPLIINEKKIPIFDEKGQLSPDFVKSVETYFPYEVDVVKNTILGGTGDRLSSTQRKIFSQLMDNMQHYFISQESTTALEGGGASRFCTVPCRELEVHQVAEDTFVLLSSIIKSMAIGNDLRILI